jgi:hypothetical protein
MGLVEVDPVGPQPLQAFLDRLEDPAPRVATAVGALTHREVDLGGEHDVVTPTPQRLSHDLLGLPAEYMSTVSTKLGAAASAAAALSSGAPPGGAARPHATLLKGLLVPLAHRAGWAETGRSMTTLSSGFAA